MAKNVIGVLINDVHLDKGNGELVKNIFNQLIGVCKKYDTNRIFCGGDVFTNRSGQPLKCLLDWKEVLNSIEEAEMELHVIPGNHDKTDGNDENSYLDVYREDFIHLYRSAECVVLDDTAVVFIPYFKDDKWLEEFNRINSEAIKLSKNRSLLMITHSGFDGVVNNDGSKVVSEIKPSIFKNYTKVLIGHYHDASKLADNVLYTGSAYQNNYGENITDKGFTVIYDNGSTKFVPSKFPKYIKETISADDKESLRNLIEKYEGENYDYIRFVFVGSKVECQNINVTEIQNKGIDCKFNSDDEVEAIKLSESDNVLEYDSTSIRKDFIKFCGENEIKGQKLIYGLELIKNI